MLDAISILPLQVILMQWASLAQILSDSLSHYAIPDAPEIPLEITINLVHITS